MSEEEQAQEQIAQLETLVKSKLTRDALVRYGNIKTAHPDKMVQLLLVLGQMIQGGQIESIDDDKMKEILHQMSPEKKGFTIKRV
jgi:DNA-binding TFAR19-related protein (PDSD5 family)|tara:strand:+ start:373 stop:627 length:255 start_codon:yes stop_codon:yes gene_type:complete